LALGVGSERWLNALGERDNPIAAQFIYRDDLPFLSEKAKHNILGRTAARLLKLPSRNDAQKQNLIKYGKFWP